MSINGKWDSITRNDLLEVATKMNIKHADEIIDSVRDAVSGWEKTALKCGVPEETVRQIEQSLIYKEF